MFPSVWLSFIFASSLLEHMIVSHFSTHYQTHTCIHTISPFFLTLFPFSMPFFLTYSASPGCMCQWHTVVLCEHPLQAQLCLKRVLLLSIDIDRTSFCVSESVPLTVSLFFLEHIPICESLSLFFPFPPSLHQTLLFLFRLLLFCILINFCQSAVLSWSVCVSSVDRLHMERSIYSTL